MARQIDRLTPLKVKALIKTGKPGRYSDGAGLYLNISDNGGRRWVLLMRVGGKVTELGLGSAREGYVTLGQARRLARRARERIVDGQDPREKPAVIVTFGEFADKLVENLTPGWRNSKHAAQWKSTLSDNYCRALRKLPIDKITTEHVLDVIQPIWSTKPETASRLRGRIEKVLDAAKVTKLRSGENPALWKGHLERLLPKRKKLTRGHHAAMPYVDVPAFMSDLQTREALAGRALEFLILTAARTGEVLGARWPEFELDGAVWTVPPERMKGGREHRVPLSAPALAIAKELFEVRISPYVFPGQARDKPLSGMAMEMMLRRMKVTTATVHGFRSSFRDWAGEETSFPREVAEAALAHSIGDQTEAAYRRGDALEKRRAMMAAWANYCARTNNVVPMMAAAG